jgi:hypothetical protein
MTPKQEQEYREEAERLAELPSVDQKAIVALHWSVVRDKEVSEANRNEARQRAKALEKLLGLKPEKESKKM